MTLHRAAPQPERTVRAPGPDDPQRATISSAEADNHPSGWQPEPGGHACVLSCLRRPGLFRKPCQPPFTTHTAAQYWKTLYQRIWCRRRAATGGAPEFSP